MYEVISVELDSRFLPTTITLRDIFTKQTKTVLFSQLLLMKSQFDVKQLNKCVAIRKMGICVEQELAGRDMVFAQGDLRNKVDLQSFLPYTASQDKGDFPLDNASEFVYRLRQGMGKKYLIVAQPFCRRYDECFIGVCENNAQNAVVMVKEYLKMQLTVVGSYKNLKVNPLAMTFDTIYVMLKTSYQHPVFAIRIGNKALVRNMWIKHGDVACVNIKNFEKVGRVTSKRQLLGISKVSEKYGLLIEDEEICSLVKAIMKEATKG